MAAPLRYQRLLRDSALKNSKGEYDFDAVLNRELYPAIRRLESAMVFVDEDLGFNVFDLTEVANELLHEHLRGYVRVSNAAPCTLFINRTPSDSATTPFASGDWVRGIQSGAGALTIVAGAGVIINFPETLVMYKQWGTFTLVNVGSNTWDFDGDVELA